MATGSALGDILHPIPYEEKLVLLGFLHAFSFTSDQNRDYYADQLF
jgi:hypothetical protein